jgi:hypothetical protein
VLIDRPGAPYLGAGEATQGPTAGPIANAVHHAIGVRLRDIPFTPENDRTRVAARALTCASTQVVETRFKGGTACRGLRAPSRLRTTPVIRGDSM